MNQPDNQPRGQSTWTVLRSVLASFIGVQSSKQHEEDFKQGKATPYIVVGLLVTIGFILAVWGVVKLVMSVVQP
ncbi:MAG: DUF2970 domain-containing protein [bacterium]